jgi:tetratricopeptide (TPR) repeat protein
VHPKTRQYTIYFLCLAFLTLSLPALYQQVNKDIVLFHRGRQALAANEYFKAAELLEQAHQEGLNTRQLFQAMGQAHISLGRWSKAETAYRQLIRLHPQDLTLQLELARILFIRGQFSQAMERVQAILERKSGWSQALYLQGKIYTAKGNFEAAIDVYQTILGERG